MEAVITKKTELDIENIEYRDIRELVEGFNAAMVNYALSENGKIIKVVTFFNTRDTDLEIVAASHNYLSKNEYKYVISKNVMYKIKSFNDLKRYCIHFWAMLWKKIDDFVPTRYTHDCTTNIRTDL